MGEFAVYQLKYGYFLFKYEQGRIIQLRRIPEQPTDFGNKTDLTDQAAAELEEYFDGKRKSFDFPYHMEGTAFQKKVWAELCRIPYGQTRTYKEIAEAVGHPKASRGVGMANHRNPISIVVPCHRVIGSNGALVGYAGGLSMKEALLSLEEANR